MIEEYIKTDGTTKEFLFNIQAGLLKGFKQVRKYGINPDVDAGITEDIWDGQGDYVYDLANVEMFAYSTNNSDTTNITIYGLIESDGKWIERAVSVMLSGNTPVTLGQFIRVFRVRVTGSVTPSGDIIVCNSSTAGLTPTNTNLRAKVIQGRNTTLMALYSVPSDYTAFIYRVYASVNKNKDAEVVWETRPFGGVFFSETAVSIFQESRQWELAFEKVSEKSDIKISATAFDNNAGVRSSFHMILVHNDALKGLYDE